MVMKTMYLHRQMDFFTFLMLFNLCIQITHLLHNLDFSPVRIPCLLVRLNYDKVKVKMKSLSHVQLFVTPRTVAYQAPPSMVFSRQEYWSGLPFTSPGDLPDPGIEPGFSTLQTGALPSDPPGKSIPGSCDKRHCQVQRFLIAANFFLDIKSVKFIPKGSSTLTPQEFSE